MRQTGIGLVTACVASLAWAASTARANVLSNMEAYWQMDEGAGTVVHDHPLAGGDDDGEITGATWVGGAVHPEHPTWSFGSGLAFDGVGDGVYIPNSGDMQYTSMTVAAWVRKNDSGVERVIVGKHAHQFSGWMLEAIGNSFAFYVGHNYPPTRVIAPFESDSEWHHVVGVVDGADVRLYVDGEPVLSDTLAGPAGFNATDVYIGRVATSNYHYWDGAIDEVRIYSRALSDSDVYGLYHTPEPTTLSLISLGGLMLARRRR